MTEFENHINLIQVRGMRNAADRLLILSDSPEVPQDSQLETHMGMCVDFIRAYADSCESTLINTDRAVDRVGLVDKFMQLPDNDRELFFQRFWAGRDDDDVRAVVISLVDKNVMTPDGVGRVVGISTEFNGLSVNNTTTCVTVWYGAEASQNGWSSRIYYMREVIPYA